MKPLCRLLLLTNGIGRTLSNTGGRIGDSMRLREFQWQASVRR
jgi:hypothetical protein